jgi:hypothetical protein
MAQGLPCGMRSAVDAQGSEGVAEFFSGTPFLLVKEELRSG